MRLETINNRSKEWTYLSLCGEIVACDPGVHNVSSYMGKVMRPDLLFGKNIADAITDTEWQSLAGYKFQELQLEAVRYDGVALKYGGHGIFVSVGESVELDKVGLDYAYATLSVAVRYGYDEIISSYFDINTHEEFLEIERLANAGDAEAQCRMGFLSCYGCPRAGVVDDICEANEWWKKAADVGNTLALNCLGQSLLWGDGVEQEHEAGLAKVREASQKGDAMGEFSYAQALYLDNPEEFDRDTVYSLLRRAASKGVHRANRLLAYLLYEECNDDDAIPLLEEAYGYGDGDLTLSLSECYFNGTGVEMDEEKAEFLRREAAKLGSPEANYILGLEAWKSGDKETGRKYFERGAELRNKDAEFAMACIYNEEGDKRNAYVHLVRSSDDGDERARKLLERNQYPDLFHLDGVRFDDGSIYFGSIQEEDKDKHLRPGPVGYGELHLMWGDIFYGDFFLVPGGREYTAFGEIHSLNGDVCENCWIDKSFCISCIAKIKTVEGNEIITRVVNGVRTGLRLTLYDGKIIEQGVYDHKTGDFTPNTAADMVKSFKFTDNTAGKSATLEVTTEDRIITLSGRCHPGDCEGDDLITTEVRNIDGTPVEKSPIEIDADKLPDYSPVGTFFDTRATFDGEKIIYPDGSEYRGEIADSLPDGEGTYCGKSVDGKGFKIAGTLKKGKFDGFCKKVIEDGFPEYGMWFDGEFRNHTYGIVNDYSNCESALMDYEAPEIEED